MTNNPWDLSRSRSTIHTDDLLNDIRAFAATLDGKPTIGADYNRWVGKRYSIDSVRRTFGTWENACKQAGVPQPAKKHFYSFQELFDHIDNVTAWRQERPSIDDLKKYNQLHGTTVTYDAYKRRWGSFSKFVKAYAQYKNGQISKKQLIALGSVKPKRQALSPSLRAEVLRRDNYRCMDCGAASSDGVKLHVHHRKPVSAGGTDDLENLVTNCDQCNLGKSDKIDDRR